MPDRNQANVGQRVASDSSAPLLRPRRWLLSDPRDQWRLDQPVDGGLNPTPDLHWRHACLYRLAFRQLYIVSGSMRPR